LTRTDDDVAELRARLAHSPMDPRPRVVDVDVRPEEPNELIRRCPLLMESQVRDELLRLRSEPPATRLRRCDLEGAEQRNSGIRVIPGGARVIRRVPWFAASVRARDEREWWGERRLGRRGGEPRSPKRHPAP